MKTKIFLYLIISFILIFIVYSDTFINGDFENDSSEWTISNIEYCNISIIDGGGFYGNKYININITKDSFGYITGCNISHDVILPNIIQFAFSKYGTTGQSFGYGIYDSITGENLGLDSADMSNNDWAERSNNWSLSGNYKFVLWAWGSHS